MPAIKIDWADQKYTITEEDSFELGERIEDIVSLSALADMAENPNFRRISRCYAEMINFAGGSVTPREIHSAMMDQIKGQSEENSLLIIQSAITKLMDVLMDGAPEGLVGDDGKKISPS